MNTLGELYQQIMRERKYIRDSRNKLLQAIILLADSQNPTKPTEGVSIKDEYLDRFDLFAETLYRFLYFDSDEKYKGQPGSDV